MEALIGSVIVIIFGVLLWSGISNSSAYAHHKKKNTEICIENGGSYLVDGLCLDLHGNATNIYMPPFGDKRR